MKKIVLIIIIFAAFLAWYKHASLNPCLYIRPGKIFNGLNSDYITDSDILITDERVQSIHPRKKPPFLCRVIEAYGSTVIPGLIDSHTHLLIESSDNTINFEKIIGNILNTPDESRLQIGKKNALSMLHSGFTRVRDLGNSGPFLDIRLKEYLDKNPNAGPTFTTSGPGLAVLPTQAGKKSAEYRIVENETDIDRYIDENEKLKLSWVKVYADNDPQIGRMNESQVKIIVEKAHAKNLKIALHAVDVRGVEIGLKLGVESIEHAYEIPISKAKNIKTAFVLTDLSQNVCREYQKFTDDLLYKNCHHYIGLRATRTQSALKQNLKIVFGSDSYADFNLSRGQSAQEALISLQEQGLTPFQALQAAGQASADMLGLNDEGILMSGSKANMLIIEGDPLADLKEIKKISYVIKNGFLISVPFPSQR